LPAFFENGGVNSVRHSTPFWKAFGGIHCSATICKACGLSAPQYEMWHSLSVALPAAPTELEQVLANHWGREPLLCDNDRCEACSVPHQRDKDVQLVTWPQVLVVHLKRWVVISMVPFVQEKVETKIDFETILPVAVGQPPYHLRGVVVHSGDPGGGHYTAYARAPNNFWYFCDDWVKPRLAGVDEVLAAEAYMLFYEK
jgi:ubiquitin C-terminal hydrolase